MNRAMWLIDAMSRRDFLKRVGVAGVAATAGTDLTSRPKYWQVNKADQFLMSPKSFDTAQPYFGQVSGHATKSGIVVNSPEKMFVPDELYNEIAKLEIDYLKGSSTWSAEKGWVPNPSFSPAYQKLSALEQEVEHGIRLVLNPDLGAEMADRRAKKKAETEASKKEDAKKAREHRKVMHRWHQKQKARRSRFDYAGGSEDAQGIDYTTLESVE